MVGQCGCGRAALAASSLLPLCPERLRPSWTRLLPAAGDGERVRLDVLGDDGAGADIGAVTDGHRRDEGGVRANEGARADVGPELVEAVVVAGDRARADVGVRPNPGVADVAEVIDLGPRLDRRLFDLDEIAYLGFRGDVCARP